MRKIVKLTEGLVAISLWQVGTDSICGDVSVESDLSVWDSEFLHLEHRVVQ